MTQAASGIDLFIPEVYDIVWSLIILVIVAVFFYKFFMPKFNAIFGKHCPARSTALAASPRRTMWRSLTSSTRPWTISWVALLTRGRRTTPNRKRRRNEQVQL